MRRGQDARGREEEERRRRRASDRARGAQQRQARAEEPEQQRVQVEGRRRVGRLEVGVGQLPVAHPEGLVRDHALVLDEEAVAVEEEEVGERREEDERRLRTPGAGRQQIRQLSSVPPSRYPREREPLPPTRIESPLR